MEGGATSSTSTIVCSTATGNPTAAPGPTQTGIVSSCNLYAMATNGTGCYDFAAANCITTAQLYAWNPVLGSKGENCLSSLWFQEYYCVGVFGSSSSSASITSQSASSSKTSIKNTPGTSSKPGSSATRTTVTAPGPTQTGIVTNCNKYAQAPDGLGCFDFATNNGITPDQLYTWNTVLGVSGSNCGTLFWKGEWYCVGLGS